MYVANLLIRDAHPEIFQKGGGVEEIFERKMFVETLSMYVVCTHKI